MSGSPGHGDCVPRRMVAQSSNDVLRGMRILAVEDQPDLRELLTILLELHGAQVTGCETAQEAFEAMVSGQRFDAAVFDISMPGEDGLALVSRLREWESRASPGHLPVIALTAHVSQGMKKQCEAAGFDRFLAKPVVTGTLLHALRQLKH